MSSIVIDTNMMALQRKLNITSDRMRDYSDKTVDDIIKEELKQGNTKALEFAKQLESDPQTLIKTYNLDNPSNKFNIFSEMTETELPEYLEFLDEDDLRMGLNFFSQEKILALMNEVAPIEEVVNSALICFSLAEVIKMMPDKELNNFVVNKDLDENFLKKNLEIMPPEVIAAMIETATGSPVVEEDPEKLMGMLYGLDQDSFQEALIAMNPNAKRFMLANMYQQDAEVMQLFPAEVYTNMMATIEKKDMMVGMAALQKETLVDMNSELPQELMAIVLTQIDPKELAKILIKDHPEMLEQIVAV